MVGLVGFGIVMGVLMYLLLIEHAVGLDVGYGEHDVEISFFYIRYWLQLDDVQKKSAYDAEFGYLWDYLHWRINV